MPTYNLLEARNLANQLLNQEQPALIMQVSENRFQVEPSLGLKPGKVKERFVFNLGFVREPRPSKPLVLIAVAPLIVILGALLLLAPRFSEPRPTATVEQPVGLETLSKANLELLVAQGQVQQGDTILIESKRIELGGYLTLLVNVNTQQSTKLVRIDLLKGQSGWHIEKWVELD